MKRTVFISYRKPESRGSAHHLLNYLSERFSTSILLDTRHSPASDDAIKEINEHIESAAVVIAVIGRFWVEESQSECSDDGTDCVSYELQRAIERGRPVLPVLVNGASMPNESQLPTGIKSLVRRNAIEVRPAHFEEDAQSVANTLYEILEVKRHTGIEKWLQNVGGQRVDEVYRGFIGLMSAAFGASALGAALKYREESSYLIPVFAALLLFSIGKNSAKLGWLAWTGLAAAIAATILRIW